MEDGLNNHNYKVLLVDDQEIILAIFETHISSLGYHIIKARNGEEALEKISREMPDLILLDIVMPVMDGYEVCRRVKENKQTRDIPVVVLTSLDKTEDLVKALECGADEFLNKTVNPVEMKARVMSLLKKKTLSDQLKSAYQHINNLTVFADDTLTNINFETFSEEATHRNLAANILRTEIGDFDKPEYILIGRCMDAGRVSGTLYGLEGGKIGLEQIDFKYKSIKESPDLDCIEVVNGSEDVSPGGRFGEEIADSVGHIRNYIAFNPQETDDILVAFNYGRDATPHEADILRSFLLISHVFKTISGQMEEIDNSFRYMVTALARAAEANDEETGNHIVRVNKYSGILAEELGMPRDFIKDIGFFAQMHDVGKIHIHFATLRKPGRLTEEEARMVRKHTVYGAMILGKEPRLKMASDIALYHHERYDGGGYPRGLKGEEIPIAARIVSVADIYDALRSRRSYKPAFSHEKAFKIISRGDDKTKPEHFDPKVLEAFIKREKQIEVAYQELIDNGEGQVNRGS